MNMEERSEFNLNGEAFEEFAWDFNGAIEDLIQAMVKHGAVKGTISARVTIDLSGIVDVLTGEVKTVPAMKYKISSKYKQDQQRSGEFDNGADKILIRGEDGSFNLVNFDQRQMSLEDMK